MTVTTITTGGPGTYTVPAGVRWISVELIGCSGENNAMAPEGIGRGGRGGRLKVLVRVRPGEVLDYCVGRLGSTTQPDLCRGGVPLTIIGDRTGGRGGGGTYIARRSYGSIDTTNRLRANMIAVAGGGGGGRRPGTPDGVTAPTGMPLGGSSIAFDALVARYVRDGTAIETAAWVKSFVEANAGSVSDNSPNSYDFDQNRSSAGRGGQHFNTVQPVLTNSFSGADSSDGGAGGGGGYQGGEAGRAQKFNNIKWGSAGGAGTSWWDPYVSAVYYDSLIGNGSPGAGRIIIDDSPEFGAAMQFGDVNPAYASSVSGSEGLVSGDWGEAYVRMRAPIDGLPSRDTGFYFVPTEGNRAVIPEGSNVPYVRSNILVTSGQNDGYHGSPVGDSPAPGESITFAYLLQPPYGDNNSTSNAWLGGDIYHRFYTRAALFKGPVSISPLRLHLTVEGEAKSFISSEFAISYTTTHPPRVTLTGPSAGAVTPVPDSSPAAATAFTATVFDSASYGAKSALYEDVVTSYRLDLYEADQTTIVKSITTTPATPFPVPRIGGQVAISATPALARSEWERVAFWRLSAKDKHGTESVQVAMRPIAMRVRPTVQIVAPVSGDVIEGSKPSILINVTTPNGSGIFTTRYQILTSSFTSVYDVTLNGLVASHTPANSVFAGLGSYIIRVTVTDLLGLSATTEIPVTSDYAAPPPVAYSIDDSRVEEDGYVEVRWQEAVAAEGFSRWNVYRREMPSSSWTLMSSIPNAGIRAYRDSTAVAGRIYMYSVTQVLVDRGGEIEGVVGVRHIPKTIPDLTNLASHTSPGYNSGDIPNGTLGFTSRAASNASFDSSVVVNPDAGAPRPLYARNLATNPSFEETSSEPFEVRRNHALNPGAVQSAAEYDQALYSGSGGVTVTSVVTASWSPSGRARRREWTTASTGAGSTQVTSVKNAARGITSGTWTFVQWVRLPSGMTLATPGTADFPAGDGRIASGDISLGNGVFKRWVTVKIASYDALLPAARIDFWIVGNRAVGDWVETGATDIYPGAYQSVRPYFDGSTSPDSTMTPAWLGATNASPSVLRSTRIEVQRNYFPDTNCTAFNSAWGGYAGNTGAAWVTSRVAASWAISGYAIQAEWTAVPDSAGDLGPVISAAPADEVWTVAFDVVVNRTGAVLSGVGFGGSQVSTSTIVAGSHSSALTMTAGVPVRRWMTFIRAATESPNGFRSATVIGNKVVGDKVQIANVDLYPGAYNPARIAATGTVSTDPDLTPAWTGTPNASPSVLTGASVTNAPPTNAARVFSQAWANSGAGSLRITPTSATTETNAAVAGSPSSLSGSGVTFTPGKTYTVLATARLASAQTGTLSAAARRIRVMYNSAPGWTGAQTVMSDQPANAPGVYVQRVTFTVPPDAVWCCAWLFNGASVGGGDVWWDDLAIIEGEYTGEWFDGSNPTTGRESLWEGAANASASILTGPVEQIPGYGGKYMSHKHINAARPTDTGGIFFSPYSHGFAGNSASNTGADGTSNLAADSGYSYTASLYVYNNTGAALGGYLAIEVYNSSGSVIGSLTAKSAQRLAAAPGWVRFSATTAQLDSSAKFIGVTWVDSSGASAPVNGEILYAGLMVERSESPLTNPSGYFNGARPNDASYNYSWLGAPWVTQSLREQISMRDEDRTFLITNSNYWLLDPLNPERSIKLPNVKQYDYTEEYERLATNIIGRGRHVDFGDRLGRTGTLVMSLREPGTRSVKREDIFAFVASKTYFILKTPFGESFPVALGNPSWAQLAGVGSSDMGDLSLPFEEVY